MAAFHIAVEAYIDPKREGQGRATGYAMFMPIRSSWCLLLWLRVCTRAGN